MWGRGFDTQAIADRLAIPEHQAARWVANFRDVVRGVSAPPHSAAGETAKEE